MQIKKDPYRAQQVCRMLMHETSETGEHYGARLSHWHGDAKTINIEADVLTLLSKAYAGEYVEVNEPAKPHTEKDTFFWRHYEYEGSNYPLMFVRLPNLKFKDIVLLLQIFDKLYGDTAQDTSDWALEFQVLTRMLVQEKSLLVNPLHLDISDDGTSSELLSILSAEDKARYMAARQLTMDEIMAMYQQYQEEG